MTAIRRELSVTLLLTAMHLERFIQVLISGDVFSLIAILTIKRARYLQNSFGTICIFQMVCDIAKLTLSTLFGLIPEEYAPPISSKHAILFAIHRFVFVVFPRAKDAWERTTPYAIAVCTIISIGKAGLPMYLDSNLYVWFDRERMMWFFTDSPETMRYITLHQIAFSFTEVSLVIVMDFISFTKLLCMRCKVSSNVWGAQSDLEVKLVFQEMIKSPCTPIPIPEGTVIDRILRTLKEQSISNPDKAAIALSFAGFLSSRGFKAGDRVTLALPNSIEWPVLHLGTWALGGSVVGSSTACKIYDTVYQLQDSSSSVVVTTEQMLETMIEAAKECPSVHTIVYLRSSENRLPDGVIDYKDTITYDPIEKITQVTMDTVCLIIYSSGTTGQPKGVIHTHRTLHCGVEQFRSHWLHEIYPVLGGREEEWFTDHQIVTTSCQHGYGFTLLNVFLVTASPVVIMRAFDGDVYLKVVEKYKPRMLFVTPPIFAFLAKDPKGIAASLASVQMIFCVAAPLGQELSDAFMAHHPNVKYIVQGFGMTEIFASHLPLLLEEGANASGGVPGAYFEQKIIDPGTLIPCKQGHRGEVLVRGAPQTIGYLNKPEAGKSLFDDEGWVHTGDIGYINERGFLYIVDRMKELIKVNYMKQIVSVFPAEIEGAILGSSRIRDVAIVGIPGIDGGELIRAYVVKSDNTLTEKDVEATVADKLAEFKWITGGVIFLDAIPRNAAGKILRRELRDNTN
uniref:G protein-coupled receptor n=1 Tax=Pristionchus pacificus TaxID=54126 RepID=A0A2A6C2E6_PRIPA|eukprot:PDM72278.1 G protein-coupled receptor [Pristionchus pacificus]